MPIRFRCAYCNQLMGIARRKAGAVVRCPKCAGEVIVPATQEPQAANGPARLNHMFEAADFGNDFADVQAVPEANALMPPPPYGHPPLVETEAPPAELPATRSAEALSAETPVSQCLTRPGVFLTVPMLIGAGTLLLVVIAVTLLLGFFLGRSTL